MRGRITIRLYNPVKWAGSEINSELSKKKKKVEFSSCAFKFMLIFLKAGGGGGGGEPVRSVTFTNSWNS